MAQVGQTTPIGSREWAIGNYMSGLRQIVLPETGTLNYIGGFFRENTTANTHDLLGAIMTSTGALLYQTTVVSNPVGNLTFGSTAQQIPFAGSPTLSAGTYIIGVASNAPDSSDCIILRGDNDATGLPTWASDNTNVDFHPTWPADVSAVIHTDAARIWNLFLDYTPGGGLTPASPIFIRPQNILVRL